jgi:hypothetical protein
MLGSFQIMDIGAKNWLTSDVSVQLRQELVRSFSRMELDLKKTRPAQISLGSGASSNSLTFRIPQDTNNDGTILDASGYIEWSADIVYALDGSGQITRTFAGTTSVVARNISSLQFTRSNSPADILQIDITASKISDAGRTMQDSSQLKVRMRN